MCEDKEQASSVRRSNASELSSMCPCKVLRRYIYDFVVLKKNYTNLLYIVYRYLQDHQVDDTGSELNYGAGKSKFYAASDRGSHASVSKLLPTNTNKDHTLYLSK